MCCIKLAYEYIWQSHSTHSVSGAKSFTFMNSFNRDNNSELYTVIIPILQMRELKHRDMLGSHNMQWVERG